MDKKEDKDPYLDELDDVEDFSEEDSQVSEEDSLELGDEDLPFPMEEPAGETPEETTHFDFKDKKSEELAEETLEEEPKNQGFDLSELASDIPTQLVVVMGRKPVTVKELLEFDKGHLIELDRSSGDAVDLVVGGKVVGKGELVEIDGKLGVRILKILEN